MPINDKSNNTLTLARKKFQISLIVIATCNKLAEDGVIQCQWCHNWEDHQCAQLSAEDLTILSKVSDRVISFCTQCFGKVPAALSTYSISEKHTMVGLSAFLPDFFPSLNTFVTVAIAPK